MSDRGHNIPDWRVTLDGADLTGKMRPRLVALTISEKRGDEADQLDIVLDDTDGQLAIPQPGAVLTVSLGWKQGRDVTIGLIGKGSFKVDEVTHSGPPDLIMLRARSADFTSEIRNRREQGWRDTTLGAVLGDIAGRNGLTLRIAPDLAAIARPSITQSRESDVAFLRRLGREYDAVATIKASHLIFARTGSGTTTSGDPLPALTIRRRDGDRHSWTTQTRDDYPGVTAYWHDRKGAKRKSFTVGNKDGAKRLRKTYASEADAKSAAIAERDRLSRAPANLDFTLALGRPDAYPEQHVTVSGFKPDIDGTTWLISEVTHRLDGNGLGTSIIMETAP
ncbi:contractile injection system protein, VgrG/Pvc8 family [Govanella unica]|uniref:Contractile injection system protein, VgrG/Pvc8 family n=1 Tax=Govanella unica TaxID=2975056 RepID=A0A9X3TVI1_9PROT|nr:contractile injection system protein, VgrG/Pvc8 family [Govania unica]MDA5192785.1 contractile injection system protein, VgrG/Pvc8 family [Govania unica]